MKIGFIGFGRMAQAIAAGLSQNKAHKLWASSPSLTPGVNSQGIHTDCDNVAQLHNTDALLLAVKPLQMANVFVEIKDNIPKSCVLISIAAGIRLSWFDASANQALPIVRAMPNIAATVSQSATPLCANQYVNEEQKQRTTSIFNSIGLTTWVQDEQLLDVFTALSGSGPAYVFLFVEALTEAAMALGLEKNIAKAFTLQTLNGALSLAQNSALTLAELREQVTSPGGTTQAALEVLIHHGFDKLLKMAMSAACNRARELGA